MSKPVQMTSAEQTGYIRRQGVVSGKWRVFQAFLHDGKWWHIEVVSARYQLFQPEALAADTPVWLTSDDAATGLEALAPWRA